MRVKKVLSLLLAMALWIGSISAFAQEETHGMLIMSSSGDDAWLDFSDLSSWAYWNVGEGKAADVFLVGPTVDMGENGNYIADVQDETYRERFVGALNMQLGIYDEIASVYAPFYRQATFPVYQLTPEERTQYTDIAYEDVKNAFLYYAENTEPSRPLILAGFSQGAEHIIRLMKDLFDEPDYAQRLVCAFALGWKLTEEDIKEYPHLVPASGETDIGTIITFNTEAEEITSSQIVAENEKTYAINPLNWKTDATRADKRENIGACFTDYSGSIEEEIPEFTGAYIDTKRGTLKVTDVNKEDYSGKLFEAGVYHLYDYQFFFRNLEKNARERLEAFLEETADRILVEYNGELVAFDVEPTIEDGRTFVPFRAIFEVMGCSVGYREENQAKTVSAHRGNDSLLLNIGEEAMYFNAEEIALEVPAKIKDSRTLVPLRAITEAFDCEVVWDADTKTVSINPPAGHFRIMAEKINEVVTDEAGNVLIDATAYYPVIKNSDQIPYIEEINEEYKWYAENFIAEAKEKKEEAISLQEQMGKEDFAPFVFTLTFEERYNIYGILSLTNYMYQNTGGMHPTTETESRSFHPGMETELSVSDVLEEELLEEGLTEYAVSLFTKKLEELAYEPASGSIYDYVYDMIGYVQFYLTEGSLVLYFDQGQLAPYAAGVISVEIPYDEQLFLVDMQEYQIETLVRQMEYDKDCEWIIKDYSEDKITVQKKDEDYPPEKVESEYFPVGVTTLTITAKKPGNAFVSYVYTVNDEGVERVIMENKVIFTIDENNRITVVTESDDIGIIK